MRNVFLISLLSSLVLLSGCISASLSPADKQINTKLVGLWMMDLSKTKKETKSEVRFSYFKTEYEFTKKFEVIQDKIVVGSYTIKKGLIYDADSEKKSSMQFKGKHLVIAVGDVQIYLKKVPLHELKLYSLDIPKITFKDNDMYINGEYSPDYSKIPWKYSDIFKTFVGKKEILYRRYNDKDGRTIQEDALRIDFKDTTDTAFFSRRFGVSQNDFIDGDWRKHSKERGRFSYDDEYLFSPFLRKVDKFKVIGKEQIKTPAGTFTCTKVEAIASWGKPMIIWMIDDMPGVYAKFVTTDYNNMHILQSIK